MLNILYYFVVVVVVDGTTLKVTGSQWSYRRKVQQDALGKVNIVKEIRRRGKNGLKINRQQHSARKKLSRDVSVRWRGEQLRATVKALEYRGCMVPRGSSGHATGPHNAARCYAAAGVHFSDAFLFQKYYLRKLKLGLKNFDTDWLMSSSIFDKLGIILQIIEWLA